MKKLLALALCAMMLLSCLVIVPAAEGERVVITACDTLDGWEGDKDVRIPDPELKTDIDPDGYGVVAFTYVGTVHSNGGWNGPEDTSGVKIHYKPANTEVTEYDLTGMAYMVMDIYVSDAALVEGVNFWFELTSSGTQDKEEMNWKQTLSALKGSELVDGWNHFEIPFASCSGDGGLQLNKWNFLRIYNGDGFNAGEGLTLAFKNFYFSSNSPQAEAAAAAAEAVISAYTLIAEIKSGDINADNYETIKAQLEAAIEVYNNADSGAQRSAEETLDISKIERTVTRALEKYEDELAEQEPVTPPAEEPDPEQPGEDPVTPPAEEPGEPDTPPAEDPTEQPEDPTTEDPTTEDPTTTPPAEEPAPAKNSTTTIIIIVAIVAVAAIVIVAILRKRK